MENKTEVGIDLTTETNQPAPTGWQRSPNRKDKRIHVGIYGCAKCGRQGTLRNVGSVKLCETCINQSGKTTTARANQMPRKNRRALEKMKQKLIEKGVVTPKE